MENLNNNKVWKIVGAVILILIVAKLLGGGNDWRGEDNMPDTITVSGKGEVVVEAKDLIATISFGVTAENIDVATAQTNSAKKMEAILAFLKTQGVDDKDIKTTNYNLYPRYDYLTATVYPYTGRQSLAAYVVSQTVEVKIRDIAKAGAVLSGVGSAGATDISGLTFSADKVDEVKNKAREEAIKDARAQAKILADQLDVRVVKIVNFSESGYAQPPIYYGNMEKVMGMGGDAVSAPLPTGENKITSNVSITYEIR